MVRAPRSVVTVSTASHFPLTFLTMVNVPSPLELKARPVPGSNPAASGPWPIAGVAITFIALMSVTAIILSPRGFRRHSSGLPERPARFRRSPVRLLKINNNSRCIGSPSIRLPPPV